MILSNAGAGRARQVVVFGPTGATENSPAFQRWVGEATFPFSIRKPRKGRQTHRPSRDFEPEIECLLSPPWGFPSAIVRRRHPRLKAWAIVGRPWRDYPIPIRRRVPYSAGGHALKGRGERLRP